MLKLSWRQSGFPETILGFAFLLFSANVPANEAVSEKLTWKVLEPFRFSKSHPWESAGSTSVGSTIFDVVVRSVGDPERAVLPNPEDYHWNPDYSLPRRMTSDYIFPKTVRAVATFSEANGARCQWEYQTVLSKEIDCTEPFEFEAITQFGDGDPTLKVTLTRTGEHFERIARVRDRLIVGFGDSFASGEGNPDLPAIVDPAKIDALKETQRFGGFPRGSWLEDPSLWRSRGGEARWLDKQCHRSVFSQHILGGMRLANGNPHESITLVPLACSGAEIFDGVLLPQENPPGSDIAVRDSQVNTAVRLLCQGGQTNYRKKSLRRWQSVLTVQTVEAEILHCVNGFRKPDAILLSVGGNDIGFSGVIEWAVLPGGGRHAIGDAVVGLTHEVVEPVCPSERDHRGMSPDKACGFICTKVSLPSAEDRIRVWLPEHYDQLNEILSVTGLSNGTGDVFLTAYPNPLYREDGLLCHAPINGMCAPGDGYERSIDINERSLRFIPRGFVPGKWELGFSLDELERIERGVILPLNREMRRAAKSLRWNFVDGYLDELKRHGICSGYVRKQPGEYPYPHINNGRWLPKSPNEIWAYDPTRERWFRTTNDSLLFQSDDSKSVINGAYHPDFRVHAVIADYLAEAVSEAWDR